MSKQIARGAAAALVLLLLGAVTALAGEGPAIDWWVIAGGGGAGSGAGVVVNDTVGQPVIGPPVSGGDVVLSAGYWAGCSAPAAVMPVVTAARDGNDILLTWPAGPANATYQVWASTDPYVDPDVVGPTTVTGATSYRDAGAALSLENHYYVVRGVNACGAASASSLRKGEFTFGLTGGG